MIFSGCMIALIVVTAGLAALRERTPGPGIVLTLAIAGVYLAGDPVGLDGASEPRRGLARVPARGDPGRGRDAAHPPVRLLYLAPKLGRSSELYGALGAATVILLWLYLEARLFVGAAFLNACLWERAHPAESPDSS